jgi:acyl carrier protein
LLSDTSQNLIDLFQTKIDDNALESPEIMNIIDKLNEEYDLVVDENDYLNKQIETLSKYRRYIEDRHEREIYELKREHHIKPNPRPNYAVNI